MKARELIKRSESLALAAYRCPVGKLTIGWGHTRTVREGMKITKAGATVLLDRDITEAALVVAGEVPHFDELRPGQQAALVSLVFNIKPSEFRTSTLLKKILTRDDVEVAQEFPRWKYGTVNGVKVVLNGLVARRREEVKLWTEL